ncbi:MAG TPA: hypothetical protein VGK86_05855 [Thermoanaerobaculia bacterium]
MASLGLFLVSRGKWSDAIIDSGREWIVPDALAQGELLYRDVVYWFGPFTPYFHAAFFRVFGSSFSTLVVAGVVGSLGVLAALYYALRTVTARREAALWTALAVPALVFMPNAGGSILGMGYRMWHAAAFALAAIAILIRPAEQDRWWRAPLAGALAALAGLCRTEWGFVTLVGAGLVVFHRETDRRKAWPKELLLFGAFFVVFAGVFVFFGIRAGWNSFTRDAPVLLLNLPADTRSHVFLAGVSAWRDGIWTLLYSTAMWLGVFFLVELVALRRVDVLRARRRLLRLAVLLLLFGVAAWRGGGLSGGLIWSAAPSVCAAACVLGLRSGRQPAGPALTGFGTLGLLLSHRRFFFIEDAPYVGPPLLFALVCAAALCSIAVVRETPARMRERLGVGVAVLLVLLIGIAFASRLLEYRKDERVPIGGTGGFLSARAELAREVEELGAAIRSSSRRADGLVVFPEGEILNFLSGRKNPVRHKLYLPGYVDDRNEGEILRELQMTSPAIVVIWRRPLGEYGRGVFGEGYGQRTRDWIEKHYVQRPVAAAGAKVYMIAGRKGS